jgi:pyrroloquinoline quinone (PQQ) biosynthesis protein C
VRSPLERDAFVASIRDKGGRRYHDRHRYHVLMHAGELTREQLQQCVNTK